MSEVAYDEIWRDGVLVSRTARTVSDGEIQRRDAPLRVRQSYAALRQWKTDADATVAEWDTLTQVQKNVRLKLTIDRFGKLADGLADLLLHQSLDA